MSKNDRKGAIVGGIVALVLVGGVAWAAIPGDGGIVTACVSPSKGGWYVLTKASCRSTERPVQLYTKDGVDAIFLTQAAADATYLAKTAKAADSDRLDGLDSSKFMPLTNCIGYPHGAIDWHGCDLHFANLDNAVLFEANLRGANFFAAGLVQADLRFSDLRDANLTRTNAFGAFFGDANLTGADLTSTTLLDADLTNAVLAGVTWNHTFCPDHTNSDDNGGTCVGHLGPAAP
jgi:uncharacterized protein YjbI with pentapeptide repeats